MFHVGKDTNKARRALTPSNKAANAERYCPKERPMPYKHDEHLLVQ